MALNNANGRAGGQHDLAISVVIPVYRDAGNALTLIDILGTQHLPDDGRLEIIVVDDGSGDGTATTLHAHATAAFRVVSLSDNRGRACARNAGAQAAKGRYLFFLDCDCRPASTDLLRAHCRVLASGAIASCGAIQAAGTGFWGRYQCEASSLRELRHARGMAFAGTAANLMVRRDVFMQAKGFDERYLQYGFEDRELLVRLSGLGRINWTSDAVVLHLDKLSLPVVVAKLECAAGQPAMLFSRDHPDAYHQLGYAAIDTRLHAWLRPVCFMFGSLLRFAPAVDRLLDRRWMPYILSRGAVKLMTALAYACGTTVR